MQIQLTQQAQCLKPQKCDRESRNVHALALQLQQAASLSHLKLKVCANKQQEDFGLSLLPDSYKMLSLSSPAVFIGRVGADCFHLWDLLTPTPVSPLTKSA